MSLKYPGKVEVINQRKFIDHYFAIKTTTSMDSLKF
jgi:hypothetical protein